jgi:transposase
MEAYSEDLRRLVLAAVDSGASASDAAAQFKVSPSWIRRLLQRRRETGSIARLPRRNGSRRRLDQTQLTKLADLVRADPGATLADLRKGLGIEVGTSTVWRALRDLGITLKRVRRPNTAMD